MSMVRAKPPPTPGRELDGLPMKRFHVPGISSAGLTLQRFVPQLQADTNATFIYLDVFAFTAEMSCYSAEHGHSVPFAPNQATADGLLRGLRARVRKQASSLSIRPSDALNERLDGNLTYYFLPLERHEYTL